MDLINALPGNSSVNTNGGKNGRETIFSMSSTLSNMKSVARQRSCKHASTKMGDGVFRGVRAEESS
jgi:hypothetical protein